MVATDRLLWEYHELVMEALRRGLPSYYRWNGNNHDLAQVRDDMMGVARRLGAILQLLPDVVSVSGKGDRQYLLDSSTLAITENGRSNKFAEGMMDTNPCVNLMYDLPEVLDNLWKIINPVRVDAPLEIGGVREA